MIQLHELANRKIGAHLFAEHQYDTVLIHSVLDGHTGRMLADSDTRPRIARLDTGAFTMLGGDPELEEVTALLRYEPIDIITPENERWRKVLMDEFGDRIHVLPFIEYCSNTVTVEELAQIIDKLPKEYELKRLNEELCKKLPDDIPNEYFFENFSSIHDFLQRGVGFCVLRDGRIVSAATSMAVSRSSIDIEIETDENLRRKGLGSIVGARLVQYCIENNITPKWLAANEDSAKLASRLGFSRGKSYETFQINLEG